jgi:hypothetical protein
MQGNAKSAHECQGAAPKHRGRSAFKANNAANLAVIRQYQLPQATDPIERVIGGGSEGSGMAAA